MADFSPTQREAHPREPTRGERALVGSEPWSRVLFEQGAVGVGLLDTQTGRLLRVNRKYAEILGYSEDEMLGLDFMRITYPEDLAADLALMERLKRGEIRDFSMEKRLLRGDGKPVWVALKVSPMWAVGEAPSQHLALIDDISARKEAERRSQQARADLESTLAALPDLLFDIDDEGRIHDFRAPFPELLAAPPSAFLGRLMSEFVPPDAASIISAAMRDALSNGCTSGHRYRLMLQGTERWFEMSIARKAAGTERPRMIAIARDVTERVVAEEQRRLLEAQLRQAQKMEAIGTLAGGIAHDFNNLLAMIGLSAALARRLIGEGHQAMEPLSTVETVVRRAEKLVQQILAFSRKQPASRIVLSLNDAVSEATHLLRSILPAGVELLVSLDEHAPRISADPTQLQQVLINLGTNAWQAIERGIGTIHFSVSSVEIPAGHPSLSAGPHARLRVADDGVGMTPATIERIFEPFFTTRGAGGGSGLGLSVVHGIVEEHGGAISVDSHPGRGTTFDILFAAEQDALAVPPRSTPAPRGDGARVLYVDDEPTVLDLVLRLLDLLGYQPSGLSDPRQALEQLRADPWSIDLLLTDLTMPGLCGIDLAREVSSLRPDLPIILVSGHAPQPDEQLSAVGIRERITKPFDDVTLGNALRTHLRRARA